MFQVWRKESSPHLYLTIHNKFSYWSIRDTLEATTVYITSASASTSCPASSSNSKNKRHGQINWGYAKYVNGKGKLVVANTGDIIVTCETPNRCV